MGINSQLPLTAAEHRTLCARAQLLDVLGQNFHHVHKEVFPVGVYRNWMGLVGKVWI